MTPTARALEKEEAKEEPARTRGTATALMGAREEKEKEKAESLGKEEKEEPARAAKAARLKEASLEYASPSTTTGRGARGPTASSHMFAA